MKKFRKGDKIALKANEGMTYVVTRKDEAGYWRGSVSPDHIYYNQTTDQNVEAVLGKDSKKWKVVERAQTAKDKRIAELVAAIERSEQSFRDQHDKQQVVDYDRDLEMLQAGWVSIERLRRNTLADVTKSYDGRSPFTTIEMRMRQKQSPSLDGRYVGEFVKAITRQD